MHNFHVLFSSDDADLILRSSDGTSFALKRINLQLASSVFETMLSLPQPEKEDRIPGKEGLDVVDMEETGSTLAHMLRFIYQDRYMFKGAPLKLTLPLQLHRVLSALRKYDCLGLHSLVASSYFPQYAAEDCPDVFAVAILHNQLDFAKKALQQFGDVQYNQEGELKQHFWSSLAGGWLSGRSPSLSDVGVELFVQIPPRAVRNFMIVQQKVLVSKDHSYTWKAAATEFTF